MSRTYVPSYYAASAHAAPQRPSLRGEVEADVCVVGGGACGLSSALHLAQRGYRVIVLEANRVGWGASGRNGGQFIFGFGCEMSTIRSLVGREDAHKLWKVSLESLDLVRDLVNTYQIDCDLVQGQMHAAIKPRQQNELWELRDELEGEYGYEGLQLWEGDELRQHIGSERYRTGLFDPNSGHLHPLNFTLGLARAAEQEGAVVHEDSPVLALEPGDRPRLVTETGTVRCQSVILAGNAYLGKLSRPLRSKLMPVGTYLGATEPLGEERARSLLPDHQAVADINFVLDYYRCSADHRMLFGGRVSYSTLEPRDLFAAMKERMLLVYPQLADVEMEYAWGGFVGITMNRAPHLGWLAPNILFAQGFSGHGVSMGPMAGKLMAEAVGGLAERFDVCSRLPHAAFPGGPLLRTPSLVLAMAYFRLRDLLP